MTKPTKAVRVYVNAYIVRSMPVPGWVTTLDEPFANDSVDRAISVIVQSTTPRFGTESAPLRSGTDTPLNCFCSAASPACLAKSSPVAVVDKKIRYDWPVSSGSSYRHSVKSLFKRIVLSEPTRSYRPGSASPWLQPPLA
jgi:hypothetical protein